MQPNLQTDFKILTSQQGNIVINTKDNSFKKNSELKSEDKCFLGTLNKIESVPDENIMDVKKLQEKSQSDNNMLGMVGKTEQETGCLIGYMTLKGGNIPELLVASEQNREGNEEKQSGSKTTEHELLKGQIGGNEKAFRLFGYLSDTENDALDRNTMVTASKAEIGSVAEKSALSEMINISVKTEENESKTDQGELNKNNAGVQISKGSEGTVGKEAGVQLLKGLGADITKTIKNSETKNPKADVEIKQTWDVKDMEKTAVTDRILIGGKTAQTGVEEAKIYNSLHIFNDEIKNSELSKKDLLLKIVPDVKEKEEGVYPSKGDNTPDEKASQQDKELFNLKEAGLKIKASGTESSADKMIQMESESKDNGTIIPKNLSGDKSLDELMTERENRLASNISRAGTLNQIVEKTALNLKNGKSQVRIDLKPEFLGSVRMKITTENHLVTVRILTELPVVKEMIENNLSQLKTDLQSHGLQIDKLDVSIANDSHQHGKDFEKADFLSQKENSDSQDNKAVSAEEETVSLLKEITAENGLDFFA
jgi:flagellar hook-length control protein FliK